MGKIVGWGDSAESKSTDLDLRKPKEIEKPTNERFVEKRSNEYHIDRDYDPRPGELVDLSPRGFAEYETSMTGKAIEHDEMPVEIEAQYEIVKPMADASSLEEEIIRTIKDLEFEYHYDSWAGTQKLDIGVSEYNALMLMIKEAGKTGHLNYFKISQALLELGRRRTTDSRIVNNWRLYEPNYLKQLIEYIDRAASFQ